MLYSVFLVSLSIQFTILLLSAWELLFLHVSPMDNPVQVDEEFLESIKKDDLLSAMLAELGEEFPEVLRALLHDRNWYLAVQIWRAAQTSHQPLVAVVGKGHLQGVVYVLCYLSVIAARLALQSQVQGGGEGGSEGFAGEREVQELEVQQQQ